jgi:hypothetical protein
LPDKSPLLVLDTYQVIPGREPEFERAMLQSADQSGLQRFTYYRQCIGGSGSEYLLIRPATSFGNAASLPVIGVPAGIVEHARSELLRFDAAMSYEP